MTQATTKRTFHVTLTFADSTVKLASVSKLPTVIAWKGKFFLQDSDIGSTYYKQALGEDLSNIEVVK